MFARLFLIFVLVPLADLVLLWIFFVSVPYYYSLLLVLLTALLGTYFSRQQGAKVLREIRGEMQRNLIPATALLDGVLVFVAGVLLITPGILTDMVGFALLFPAIRAQVREKMLDYLKRKIRVETVKFTSEFASGFEATDQPPFGSSFYGKPHFQDEDIIEGEVINKKISRQSSDDE